MARLACGTDSTRTVQSAKTLCTHRLCARTHGRRIAIDGIATANVGSVLLDRDQLDEAESLLREAVRIRTAIQGPDAFELAYNFSMLGHVVYRNGGIDEGTALLEEAVARFQAAAPELPAALQARLWLAEIVWESGDPQRALTLIAGIDGVASGDVAAQISEQLERWQTRRAEATDATAPPSPRSLP